MSKLQAGLMGLGLLVLLGVGLQFFWVVYVPRWRQARAQRTHTRQRHVPSWRSETKTSAHTHRIEPQFTPHPFAPPSSSSSSSTAEPTAAESTSPLMTTEEETQAQAHTQAPPPIQPDPDDLSALVPTGPEAPWPLTSLERAFQATPIALDAVLDLIVPIAFAEPISGTQVLAALPKTARIGSKRYAIEGKNQETAIWEFPARDKHYVALRAGIQRANRTGPMNAVDFSDFTLKTQAFVQALQRVHAVHTSGQVQTQMPSQSMSDPSFERTSMDFHVQFPPMHKVLQYARALDQFAQSHDAYLAVFIRSWAGHSWSVAQLQRQAHQLGFVPGPWPGRMVWTTEMGSHPWLVLQFDSNLAFDEEADRQAAHLSVFELGLSASQAPRQANGLARLHDVAHALAQVLGGRLTDEQGKDISAGHWPAIATQLAHVYDELDEAQMPAGSPLLMRLLTG
jgi:hypothetical protein